MRKYDFKDFIVDLLFVGGVILVIILAFHFFAGMFSSVSAAVISGLVIFLSYSAGAAFWFIRYSNIKLED